MAGPGFGDDLMEELSYKGKLIGALFEGGGHLIEALGSADGADIFPEDRSGIS